MTEINYSTDVEILEPDEWVRERVMCMSVSDPYLEDTSEGQGVRAEIIFDQHAVRRLRDICNDFLEAGDAPR